MLKQKQLLIISLLVLSMLAVWIVFDKRGSINIDGVLYLRQANFFLQGRFDEAFTVYRWPFFGFLISQVSNVTGLSLIYSAQLINVSAFVVACFFYLKTLMLITRERYILLAGSLVIMMSTSIVDSYLPMLLRDNGMWAGLMMGVYFYLRWLDAPSYLNAILFQVALIFGALFRVELFILIIVIFFASPWIRPQEIPRRIAIWMASLAILFSLLIASLYGGYHLYMGSAQINWGRVDELFERPLQVFSQISHPLPIAVVDNSRELMKLLGSHGLALKLLFLSYVAIYKWLAKVGLLHLLTAYVCLRKRLIVNRFIKPILLIFFTSLAIAFINLPHDYVLSGRYLVMNLWIVYLMSAVGLAYLISQLSGEWSNRLWLKIGLASLIFAYLTAVLIDKPRNMINPDTVAWIREHKVNLDRTYINNMRLCFYLGRFECADSLGLEGAKAAGYDFLVLEFHSYELVPEIDGYEIVKKVPDREHPEYVIYKKH